MKEENPLDAVSQTKNSFKDKWENNSQLGYTDIFDEKSEITSWILRRNAWPNFDSLSDFLNSYPKILDAGCGNGRITALFSKLAETKSITGIDINPEIAKVNLSSKRNVNIYHHDLGEPIKESFDFIYSQEVLHHTQDPKKSFANLVEALNINGLIAIYVYKKKGPVREFTDEYIRGKLMTLSYEEAIEKMSQITKFGETLSKMDGVVEIEKLELLEIPKGSYTVQRLFYHFFFKCFWNLNLTAEENDAINFDWYSPQLATKHTLPEIRNWFESESLQIVHEFEDEYGITMHGKKIGIDDK